LNFQVHFEDSQDDKVRNDGDGEYDEDNENDQEEDEKR